MKSTLVLVVLIEVLYGLITRLWLPELFSGIQLELLVTGCRAVIALFYWEMFRDLIREKNPKPMEAVSPYIGVAVILVFLVPILTGNFGLQGPATKAVFALTSIIVGIREEFVYRGILQNIFTRWGGGAMAIVGSNLLFTISHIGAQKMVPWNIFNIFATGCILGLLYARTGSLLLVIALHSLLDAVWAYSPFLESPLSHVVGSVLVAAALALCVIWAAQRSNPSLQARRP